MSEKLEGSEQTPSPEQEPAKVEIVENELSVEQQEEALRYVQITCFEPGMEGQYHKLIKDVPVYGPIDSRRCGRSLGLNLVDGGFMCDYECAYCEYREEDREQVEKGLKKKVKKRTPEEIGRALESWLQKHPDEPVDSLTFAGNTEPLLNGNFPVILDQVIKLRDRYRPGVPITLFTDSSRAAKYDLSRIDNVWLKLDVGSEGAFRRINQARGTTLEQVVEQIKQSNPKRKCIQTMIMAGADGNYNNQDIADYVERLLEIRPDEIGLYSVLYRGPHDRDILPVPDEALIDVVQRISEAFEKSQQSLKVTVFKNGEVFGKERAF